MLSFLPRARARLPADRREDAAATPRAPTPRKARQQAGRTLAELLPWLSLHGDAVVLCKDGSLLACMELGGLDADGVDVASAARAAERVEHALRALDERFVFWSTFQRRRIHGFAPGQFPHPCSARLDAVHGEHLRAGRQFCNRHVVSLLYTPAVDERAWRGVLELVRRGALRSVFQYVRQQCNRDQRFSALGAHLTHHRARFEAQLEAFSTTLGSLAPRRLRGAQLLGFLNSCASPASGTDPVSEPGSALFLDALLGEDHLQVGADSLCFSGAASSRHIAALGIKAWPDSTVPGLIEGLLRIPAELSVTQVFRFVSIEAAKAHIQSVQRFHLNLERSAFSFLREAVFGEAGEVHDGTRAVSAAEARDALADLAQHRQVYGYFNLSVLIAAESKAGLEIPLREAAATVREAGFLVLREGLHLLSAWTGLLPGQWTHLARWHFIHTGNLADLLPLHSPGVGEPFNHHLSEQLGHPCPALCVLSGIDQTSFHFNFHHGDLGHAFVVGPSRSGKSVLMNFLLAQFLRYPDARVLIFDKDRSCRIATLLQGGRHFDPANGELACNPLCALREPQGRQWLSGWLERLLCLRGYRWTSQDDLALEEALGGLALLPTSQQQLHALQALLPPALAAELAPWVGQGPRAHLFDHGEDGFACEGLTCIEMGEILRDEALGRVFMDYAFARVEALLGQARRAPSLIYIEEAWFMLAHPVFRERIRDWLKTLPKRLALVVMATQSLDDLASSPIFSAIADNVPTRIFLANRNAPAQDALYGTQFGLNAAQIQKIARAEAKRQFLVVTPRHSRFIDLALPQEAVNILRSDQRAQDLFDRARREHPTAWAEAYLSSLQAHTA